MKNKAIRLLFTASVILLMCVACKEDEKAYTSAAEADYSECDPQPIDNQKIVCNDFKESIEDLCGFGITIDPCSCAMEASTCTQAIAWINSIISCGNSSSSCSEYADCLEKLGTSPETDYGSCTNPMLWDCIILPE